MAQLTPQSEKLRAAFFGTSSFAIPILKVLLQMDVALVKIVTQPAHSSSGKLIMSPVAEESQQLGLTLETPAKISSFDWPIPKDTIDICMLAAYGNIIPSKYVSWPHFGWINVHPSLLPQYRGPSPIQAAIRNGDKKTGVTLIQMDAGVDTGDIIAQSSCEIAPQETSITLTDKLGALGATLLQQTLFSFIEGSLRKTPQLHADATFTKKIQKSDGKLNFSLTAHELDRQIRALQPWPGSFAFFDTHRFIIHSALPKKSAHQKPGQLIQETDGLAIVCGNETALSIQSIQIAGKQPISGAAFLRGYEHLLGTVCR